MSTNEMIRQLEEMPAEERRQAVRTVLAKLYPPNPGVLERFLRRLEHPDVPEDVWEGFEQAEDGRGIEMRDEHFDNPPA